MIKRLILLSVLLQGVIGCFVAQGRISFFTLTTDNGLSDNYIETVYEDDEGVIWIATHNGLSKYDGKAFSTIQLPASINPNLPASVRNNVLTIAQDKDKNLWIGSLGGLYIYSRTKNTFKYIVLNAEGKQIWGQNLIEEIIFTAEGNAWIGTRDGLYYYNTKTNAQKRYENTPSDTTSLSNNYICSLFLDEQQGLWVGTRNGGLDYLPTGKREFKHYTSKNQTLRFIRGITRDAQKRIWVVTAQDGLFCKKENTSNFEAIALGIDIKKNFLSSIASDHRNCLWIGTSANGILYFNPTTNQIVQFTDNSPLPQNLSNNSVSHVLCDRTGNIWIATQGGGVCQYAQSVNHVQYYYKTPFSGSLPGNIVSCFCQDSHGRLWIGTDGNGFCRYDKPSDRFEYFNKQQGLSSNSVLSICELPDGRLAVATWNGGLNVFNPQTKQIVQYTFASNRNDGQIQDIYGITLDKRHNVLWCNSYGDGIQMFDYTHNKFLDTKARLTLYKSANTFMYSSKTLFENDTVWLVDGLNLSRQTPDSLIIFNTSDTTKGKYDGFFCFDILKNQSGNILSCNHSGVLQYSRKEKCLKILNNTQGAFRDARAILEDAHGILWITSSTALYRYSPKTQQIQNLTMMWGMPQMAYFRKSAYRSADGHLYFGGTNGYVILHEDSSYTRVITPKTMITRLWINNKEIRIDSLLGDISLLKNIDLNYDESFLSIEFAALNYVDNAKSRYRYMLEGFDKEWINAGEERKATYTNISPGTYTFKLYTTQSNGAWNKTPLLFTVKVSPPWWRRWWFYLIWSVLITLSIIALMKIRENRMMRQNKRLKERVDEKTQELQAGNEALRQQKEMIENSYELLRENQLVIEMKNDQLQDALTTKDRLMTVIAHDFRNPLNTLLGLSRVLQKKIETQHLDPLKPTVEHLVKSSEALQDQMEIVLDWSIGNNETVRVKPIEINPEILIKDVLVLLNEVMQQKHIDVTINNSSISYAYIDPRMISTVFRNLITNSIQFTPDYNSLAIVIEELDTEILVRIIDTGVGMSPEQVERIMSEQGRSTEEIRTGFGLQIAKAFIKRNNGRLEVFSSLGHGTEFIVYVPKGTKISSENKIIIHNNEANNDWHLNSTDMRTMLVVDDNKSVTHFLRELFQDSFTVTESSNGYDAHRLANELLPDIILSDINMPMLDGKKLCHQLKTDNVTAHIPIVLLSANSLPKDQIDGLLHGADDYVTKPFDADLLRQKIFSILKNRELTILHFRQHAASPEGLPLSPSYDDKIINQITDIILKNISNPDFSVEQLTDQCGLSRSQLYRKTMAILGQSPSDYIKTIRFQHAARLLKTGKYRISEVAYEVGFTDARYFSSSFSKHFGVTPSGYKEAD